MPFVIKDDDVLDKYSKLWDKIKETLSIKIHSMPVYDEKYIKAKRRGFNDVIKTNFLDDKIPKENLHYFWFACITIEFIEAELESESESESESDIELELKSELKFDTE